MRYVYLVRAGANKYKIGVSRNVSRRVAALQTSNIHLVEVVCAKRTSDDALIERALHKKVREFSGTGGKEWFHLTPEQAIEVAIEISKAPDIDIAENIIQDIKGQVAGIIETYEQKVSEEVRLLQEEKRIFEEAKKNSIKPKVLGPRGDTTYVDQEAIRKAADEKEYKTAVELVRQHRHASTSFLQRRMRIGYGKAARLIERMEEEAIIGPLDGIHRDVL